MFCNRIPRSLLVGGILAYFNPVQYNRTDKLDAFLYAGSLIFSTMFCNVIGRYAQIEMEHCGMKLRLACCSIIYKKVKLVFNNKKKNCVLRYRLSNFYRDFHIGLIFAPSVFFKR